MKPDDYDYSSAGFDGFLSRSIDDLSQTNLDSAGPTSTAIRYDSSQLSGYTADKLNVSRLKNINIGRLDVIEQLRIVDGDVSIYDDSGQQTIINGRLVGSKILAKAILTNTIFTDGTSPSLDLEVPGSALNFTIPDGVHSIKISLNTAGAGNAFSVYRDRINGFYPSAEFTTARNLGAEMTGIWFKDVMPGEEYTYLLGVSNSSGTSYPLVENQPLVFMIEIA